MSKNDITGDKLVSKVQSEKFSEGYDRIWGKPKSVAFDVPKEPSNKLLTVDDYGKTYRFKLDKNFNVVPLPPAGYTAEELERDNPYNQWMYEGENEC